MTKGALKCRRHAKKRALERYGLELGPVYGKIMRQIRNGGSVFIEKVSKRRTLHIVWVKNEALPVIYDKDHKEIATVLPRKSVRKYGIFLL